VRVRRGPATVTGEPAPSRKVRSHWPEKRAGKAGKTVEARSQETCHRLGLIRFAEGGMSRGILRLASWPGFFVAYRKCPNRILLARKQLDQRF